MWAELFDAVVALAQDKALAERWKRRLSADQYPGKVLFFRPDEAPVNVLAPYFVRKYDNAYVVRAEGAKPQFLKAEYRFYDDGDFLIGSGFNSRPTPPGAIRYPRWRLVLGDIVALLISMPFFALPFFITGARCRRSRKAGRCFFFWPDRLSLSTYKGTGEFRYRDMAYFQPVVFKPHSRHYLSQR